MKSMTYKVLTASLIATGMFLGGCNSSSSTDPAPTPEATLIHGVVSAATVYDWVTDWDANRPEHIEGRLFIIQFGAATAESTAENPNDYANIKYIKHDGTSVITVDSKFYDFSETRNDGVSNVPSSLPSGGKMDEALAKLGINPNEDMLLFVSGDGSGLMGAARLWFTMSYWGVKPENMALMNGSALHQFQPNNGIVSDLSDIFVAEASAPLDNGVTSVKDLTDDNTFLNASMQDMMELVAGESDDYLVVDARAPDEYRGEKPSSTEEKTCGTGTEQCVSAFVGHIKGAANIDYTTLYNGADHLLNGDLNGDGKVDAKDASATFKSIDELEAIYTAAGYETGQKLYTYCRTGARASINSFVQMQILGYPTAMYDASWIQWGKMADRFNKDNLYNLAVDSKWRTDVEKHSDPINYHLDPLYVQQINGLDIAGESTRAIIEEDKAYKTL